MKSMNRLGTIFTNTFAVMLCSLILTQASPAFANDQALPVDDEHRGKVSINDQFYVFPENRMGNAVYNKKGVLYSEKGVTMRDALSVKGGTLFFGVTEKGDAAVNFLGAEQNTFKAIAPGYWQLKTPNWVSKIYRISQENKIEDILPISRTGNGLVFNGDDRVAFFHITSSKSVEDAEGKTRREYHFKIHVLKKDWKTRNTLAITVKDTSPVLQLNWVGKKRLKYTLNSGEKRTLSVP